MRKLIIISLMMIILCISLTYALSGKGLIIYYDFTNYSINQDYAINIAPFQEFNSTPFNTYTQENLTYIQDTDCLIGDCVNFTSTQSAIIIPEGVPNYPSVTMSVWIRSSYWNESDSQNPYVFDRYNDIGTTTNTYNLQYCYDGCGFGSDAFFLETTHMNSVQDNFGYNHDTPNNNLPLNYSWHQFVITFDNETTNKSLYVDGILRNSTIVGEQLYFTDIENNYSHFIVIGNYIVPSDNHAIIGLFDEFSFWNRSLNADEVNEMYNNGQGLIYNETNYIPQNETNETGCTNFTKDMITILNPLNNSVLNTNYTEVYTFINTTGQDCYYDFNAKVFIDNNPLSGSGCDEYGLIDMSELNFFCNITDLINGTHIIDYKLEFPSSPEFELIKSTFITINTSISCIESWIQNNTLCNGINYTIQYYDLNNCGTFNDLPLDNGLVVDCTPLSEDSVISGTVNSLINMIVVLVIFAVMIAFALGFMKMMDVDADLVYKILIIALIVLILIIVVLSFKAFTTLT